MKRYLNLSGFAWRQLRRNWPLSSTPALEWQTRAVGPLLAFADRMQHAVLRDQLPASPPTGAIVIAGYWRSGTTLLHELLSLDPRYTFPTTHACMNPHHFLLSEASALAASLQHQQPAQTRPMDEMEIRPGSPQEDEFALLSLGARSPYEALLVPGRLPEALLLADPLDLPADDQTRWRAAFLNFVTGVSFRGGGRPPILKSPTHGFRLAILRQLLPEARFIVITRDPYTHFESVVRMWRTLFEMYALHGAPPPDDAIREAVLADRPRFEAKLQAGSTGLPANRFALVKYEALAASPETEIERLYAQLELGGFESVQPALRTEVSSRGGYKAKGRLPSEAWRQRLESSWKPAFDLYDYPIRPAVTDPSQ